MARGDARVALRSIGDERSDGALLREHLAGDQRAFEVLVRRHERLVYALVRRYAARPEDAADLVQKSFLKAFAAAGRVFSRRRAAEQGVFRAWLLRIAVNVGKNHARDAKRWRWEEASAAEERPSDESTGPELLEEREQRRRLRALVVGLPRRQREVLTLRIDGGLPFAEVARTLGITENNAKVAFHHAVKRLKAEIR